MNIIISNESKLPIYEQLKRQLKDAICTGQIGEGEPLPSIRALARDLKISVITTMRAYNDLESEGFVANVQGKGCFVKPQNAQLMRENKLREIEENLQKAAELARPLGITAAELAEMLKLLSEDKYE